MPRDRKRRSFLVGLGSTASLAIAGCLGDDPDDDPVDGDDDDDGGDSDSDDGDDSGDDGDDGGDSGGDDESQLELLQTPRETIDPIGRSGPSNAWTNWMTHEQLFNYEDGTPPVVAHLADDYSVSDDYLTYTVDIRQGITFHNGDEVTAQDFVYSWRRLVESENNRGHADRLVQGTISVEHELDDEENIVPESLAVEAVDEYTLEFTLERPFHDVLGALADPRLTVIPEGIVGDIEGYEGEYDYDEWVTEHIHGTGPFQLDYWEQGSEIVVEAFDDYHGTVPDIDRVRLQILEDPNAQYTRAVNEQGVDIFSIPRSQFDPELLDIEEELDGRRRHGSYGPVNDVTLNYGETTSPRIQYLVVNHLRVELAPRRALAYLVDQETLADEATRGQGQSAYFITPPGAFPGGPEAYQEMAEEEYPYSYGESDIDSAQAVMEEAGYGPDDTYETAFQHPSDEQGSEWGEIGSILRDLGESAYLDIEIEPAPTSSLTNRAIDGDIDLFGTWNALEWLEADAVLQYAYPNPFGWSNWGAEVDFEYEEMTETAQQAVDAWTTYEEHNLPTDEDLSVREQAYLELERANWDEVAMLPLWHPVDELYWYDWVEGFEVPGSQRRPAFNDISLGDRS